jgi:hypothetical protein
VAVAVSVCSMRTRGGADGQRRIFSPFPVLIRRLSSSPPRSCNAASLFHCFSGFRFWGRQNFTPARDGIFIFCHCELMQMLRFFDLGAQI